jgi:3-oxoacyl-[acyl-carrier protein] reductase
MAKLSGRTAVVTGASSGIGRGVACLFAQEGAEVALVARRADRLQEICQEITNRGGKARPYIFDLYQSQRIRDFFKEIEQDLGAVDILVNNAGIGFHNPLTDVTVEEYEQTFDLNVKAVVLVTQALLPGMMARQDGVIINIGSISGKIGMSNLSIYCASKFALRGFTHSLLEEVRRHNIKVSLICPGLVNTEFFQRRKVAPGGNIDEYIQPEDIAEACLLCASASQTATLKEIVVRPRRPVT